MRMYYHQKEFDYMIIYENYNIKKYENHFKISIDGNVHPLYNEWLSLCQYLCKNGIVDIFEMKHIIDIKYNEELRKLEQDNGTETE